MKKIFLLFVLFSSLFLCCKQEEDILPGAVQSHTGAVTERGNCTRVPVVETGLAPFCGSSQICLPGAYLGFNFDAGELNKHVNGCPTACPDFVPRTGWIELGDVYSFCSDDPAILSIAGQDIIMQNAHTMAKNYLNNHHNEVSCIQEGGGSIPVSITPTYRIHFDRLGLPCICDPNCPTNSRIRVWVQLGCCFTERVPGGGGGVKQT